MGVNIFSLRPGLFVSINQINKKLNLFKKRGLSNCIVWKKYLKSADGFRPPGVTLLAAIFICEVCKETFPSDAEVLQHLLSCCNPSANWGCSCSTSPSSSNSPWNQLGGKLQKSMSNPSVQNCTSKTLNHTWWECTGRGKLWHRVNSLATPQAAL
jgi:hypothetical protein